MEATNWKQSHRRIHALILILWIAGAQGQTDGSLVAVSESQELAESKYYSLKNKHMDVTDNMILI